MTTRAFHATGARLAVLLAAAACTLAVGCSPSDPANRGGPSSAAPGTEAAPSDQAAPSEETGASDETGEGSTVSDIDACALISPEDVEALLGTAIEGVSTSSNPEVPACLWENPENYESISLEIGNPDTAINGTLPPPEPDFPDPYTPGPDGMRFLGEGSVEFVADKRNNHLQVAVLSMLGGNGANEAAVDLARKVIAQLEG